MIKSKNMERKINVHWSWFTRIVTILVSLVFVGIVWRELKNFLADSHNYGSLLYIFICVLLLVVYAINAPISVRLTPQYFELKKIVGRIRIEYTAITHVERYKPSFWDLRVFGSAGFFGYIGFFRGDEIGSYKAFMGDTGQAFLIRTVHGNLYVFSTETPDKTIEELKKRIIK